MRVVWALSLAWAELSCRMRSFRPLVPRGCACPTGCSCGGYAAGALLGWLCPLGFGWVHGRRLARVRLSCRVRLRRLCRRCTLGLAVPLGLGGVLGVSLALVRISCRVLLRRLRRRCAFGLAVPLGFGLDAWPRGCAADTLDLDVPPLSPYKQSPPLRGGCRRQPAGGGMVYALIPPASLIPGRSGSYVSACAVRHDLRSAALQLFTTAPSVSEYFALYLQYDCTAARQRYAAKTAAAANSGWEVWAWPYLQKGGPVTVRPTE